MPSASELTQSYVLGIDLGSASLGWALVGLDGLRAPTRLIRTGVRIFEPGVDGTTLEIEQGKDQSKAVERRMARLQRRQLRRRAYRQAKLFQVLQTNGLLPQGAAGAELSASQNRNMVLTALDREIGSKWAAAPEEKSFAQAPLYRLRKAALDEKLTPYEVGRVLYHLCQRRGFKSNRKEGRKESEKDLGVVKEGIAELASKIATSGARTLGEYLAGLDPHEFGQNIRRRWTARRMFEDEFEKVWDAQSGFYPELMSKTLKGEVAHWLFFQRPIAAQSHLIGRCELEGGNYRRAAWATLEAQRFRILQKVNDLKIIHPGNPIAEPLTPDQRAQVYEALDVNGDQSFIQLRRVLNLPKGTEFNLERGEEKRLRGNRTNKTMRSVFGERWGQLSDEERKEIIEDWRTCETDEVLVRHGMERWGLDEVTAKWWTEFTPEPGFCALSRKAICRLLPLMQQGMSFKEAETQIYGNRFSGGEALDQLPPLHVHRKLATSAATDRMLAKLRLGAIRNPAVERALTELRKVVNAIIREHGKPYEIRIELARELKKPRKERKQMTDRNRQRQKEREKVKSELLRECGIQNPSRADIEKALLHAECGGICPYTGHAIALSNLFGPTPQFDVEHIIPLSRYPDDSFQNKTLCWHEENRSLKRNRTPFEAYGADSERWDSMLTRIRAWKPGNAAKLRRFMLRTEDELEDFSARQMNDTRYASVLAGRLLETLYGGRDVVDGNGTRQVIYASSGAVTATLRRAWELEAILREAAPSNNGSSRGKPRTDHRHHAIDAITIALTKQAVIQAMSRSASMDNGLPQGSRAYRAIPSPWPEFVDSIRPHIIGLVVSHRPEHKMTGALHDETNYSRPYQSNGKTIVHIRKPVAGLTGKDIENIVDPAVRVAVAQKAENLNGDLSKCESSNSWPLLPSKSGGARPIKRVRMRKVLDVTPIASNERERFVSVTNSHHTAVFALLENDREAAWEGIPVSLFEAMERKRRSQTIVQKTHPDGPQWKFKFSLMGGDTVELHRNCSHEAERCAPEIYRVRTIAGNGQLCLVRINDARLIKDIKDAKEWWSPRADSLRKLDCRKVSVDTLGRVHPAND